MCDGADLVGELAVLRVLPLQQRLHVLVGEELRQVVADHFAEMREQHRHVVGEGEVLALQILGEHLRHRIGAHAEGRLAHLLARNVGRVAVAEQHHHFADANLVFGDDRAVHLDLVALARDVEVVGEPDLRNDEAVLRGELLAHLADPEGEFLVRRRAAWSRAACRCSSSISAVFSDALTELRSSSLLARLLVLLRTLSASARGDRGAAG